VQTQTSGVIQTVKSPSAQLNYISELLEMLSNQSDTRTGTNQYIKGNTSTWGEKKYTVEHSNEKTPCQVASSSTASIE